MTLDERASIPAPPDIVWAVLMDPVTLARTIPGCQRLDKLGDAEYTIVLRAGIAAITGTFTGSVRIEAAHPSTDFTLIVDGQGTAGFVRGRAHFTLAPEDSGTAVAVSADGQVGGLIASVGQRLLQAAARRMMGDFVRALQEEAKRSSPFGI